MSDYQQVQIALAHKVSEERGNGIPATHKVGEVLLHKVHGLHKLHTFIPQAHKFIRKTIVWKQNIQVLSIYLMTNVQGLFLCV